MLLYAASCYYYFGFRRGINEIFLFICFIFNCSNLTSINLNKNSSQSVDSASFASNQDESVKTLLNSRSNTSKVYLDDYYSTQYFYNLKENFGNNVQGTCSYVAIGMLLSYYDTYLDDAFIPEEYDVASLFESQVSFTKDFDFPAFDANSPGIKSEPFDEVLNLNKKEYLNYIEETKNIYFQSKLIDLGLHNIIYSFNEDSRDSLGMTFEQIQYFLDYYVHIYRSIDNQPRIRNISIFGENSNESNVKTFVLNKVKSGIPVILRAKSSSIGTHAFIAYDCDSNGRIYVHTGWKDTNGNRLTHVPLDTLSFTELLDASCIIVSNSYKHIHSDNYISNKNNKPVCSCMYSFPQEIKIASGNYRDASPMYMWKSLKNERWLNRYKPYFNVSFLSQSGSEILYKTKITKNEIKITHEEWEKVLFFAPAEVSYFVYIELYSETTHLDDYYFKISIDKPKIYQSLKTIKPSDYGFADCYTVPACSQTSNVEGVDFETTRYRTGFIQGEYIVLSSVRTGYSNAYIEYTFETALSRIDVELCHWREASNEYLTDSNGKAVLQQYIGNEWVDVFDLLSSKNSLPRNRKYPTLYNIEFLQPAYKIRFYTEYFGAKKDKNNRGRICIGNMTLYETEFNLPLSGDELNFNGTDWTSSSYNCYAYALNTKNHGFMQPGQSDAKYKEYKNNTAYLTKDFLYDMVQLDSINYNFKFKTVDKNTKCSPGYYKVALVIAPNLDYHWYRQNKDGTWSHKSGRDPAINYENKNSSNLIFDPETCNRGIYSLFCGFYEVNINGMM